MRAQKVGNRMRTQTMNVLHSQWQKCCAMLLVAICFSMLAPSATAQLPRDVKDMFQGMLGDLDDDLRKKFEKAIEEDTATVEFSAEEFLRFRSDPINPFEGLDKIDVDMNGGSISLKFELPSIRNRKIQPFERQDRAQLDQLTPVIEALVPSVIAVMHDNRQIALGTVVAEKGYIVTKASEINTYESLSIVTSDAREYAAELVFENEANDIAILHVDATLQAIDWEITAGSVGQFLVLPAPNGKAFSMGTLSVGTRTTQTGKQARLGVNPDNANGGVAVSEILPNTAAFEAGLIDGDIITHIDGEAIVDVDKLVNVIRKNSPGDTIEISFLRDGVDNRTRAVLDSFDISGERAKRYKMMSRLGAIPSRRADNFPAVFQHDAPLFPEQCGGPVVDLKGKVIGINIARNGRAATYAIPLENVQRIIRDFLRESVAARPSR